MSKPREEETGVDIRYAGLCACIVPGLPFSVLAANALASSGMDLAGIGCYLAWLLGVTIAWRGLARAGDAYRQAHVSRVAGDLRDGSVPG